MSVRFLGAGFLGAAIFFSGCSEGTRVVNDELRIPGMEKYHYRTADGGPHILLPLAVAAKWKGSRINMVNPLDPKTDYGRACSIKGEWELIDVAGMPALVLADPPMSACSRSSGTNELNVFVLHAWEKDDLDSLLDRASSQASLTETKAIMRFDEKGAALIFAGDKPGETVYGEARVALEPGQYRLFTGRYKGTGVEEVAVYRLKRIPNAEPTPAPGK